ncbi:MAG: aldose 1-epimerase family protein [Nocardioidaceae bacterium]
MVSPSGSCCSLACGTYEAEIVEVGAGLRRLTNGGYDVVAGYSPTEMASSGRGQLLLPWPNRIEDGSYRFRGTEHQLSLSEAPKRNAIHGLTRWVNWQLRQDSADQMRCSYLLHPQPGYPFCLDLSVDYLLSDSGLQVSTSAQNLSGVPAPYACGAHPYLTVGRRVDRCVFTLPAATRSDVDQRGLPLAPRPVSGGEYDFRSPRPIGELSFDHPFGELVYVDGTATANLVDPETGRRASVAVDEAYRWLQVFSGDSLATGAREALAVEPMTSPPNAFRSGVDLVVLGPGERHTASFVLS